ncbi:MAG: hypothetical protein H6662_15650 [Ardenticatenaceae bacterium]|nr:hypothetical protein [Anaerolineales bacterium]MCB8923022.1 hypothetical protein [Ardenticatenaceae bacterium]
MSVKLADALVYLAAENKKLKDDLAHAERETNSWVKRVGEGMAQGLGQALTNWTIQGVQKIAQMGRQGVRALAQGMVGGNAEFEQYNQQFGVLLKSATAAQQRMQELEKFGRTTPFDLPEVVKADLILQGFGLHAEEAAVRFGKSGAEIRTIAGDVASGTSATFEEISGYLGRFSSGATGEAIQRFQELGIVTRRELAAMGVEFSKSGELVSPLDEAMTILLQHLEQKYGGMMDAQSTTFNGMLSNLRDWVGNSLRLIGQPTFELIKGQLKDLLAFLDSPAVASAINGLRDLFAVATAGALAIIRGFSGAAKAFFRSLFGDFDTVATNLENNAGSWGRNIVLQLARGMAAAATAVVRVLNQIASIIAYWLKPGSPPKILPDIDTWGTGAMQAWLDGFGSADVGVLKRIKGRVAEILQSMGSGADVGLFSTISNAISGLFRSQAKENDTGLVGRILGSNEAIAKAISDIRQMGGIGQQTLQMLETALGSLPPVALAYTQAMLSLAQADEQVRLAQEELTRVTDEYANKLKPLNNELEAIQNKRQDMADEKRIAALKEALASGSLNANEEELALMEIRERQLRKEIRDTEEARDTAVEGAQEQLDAAEAEQEAAQEAAEMQAALLQAQQESNDLINQQVSLLGQLANALAGVGSALETAVGSGGGGLGDALGGLGDIAIPDLGEGEDPLGIESLFESMDIEGLVAEITAEFEPLNEEASKIGDNFRNARDAVDDFLAKIGVLDDEGKPARGALDNIKDGVITLGGAFAAAKIAGWVMGIVTSIGGLVASEGIIGAIGAAVAALGGPVVIIAAIVGAFAAAWHTDFMGMRTTLEQVWAIISIVFQQIGDRISTFLAPAINAFKLIWEAAWAGIKAMLAQAWANIQMVWAELGRWINHNLAPWVEYFQGVWEEGWAYITAKLNEAWASIQEVIGAWKTKWESLMTSLHDAVQPVLDMVQNLWDAIKGFWDWLKDKVFDFDFHIPDLPDWAIPGSPIPLHTAWKAFAEDMNRMTIRPKMDTSQVAGAGFPNSAAAVTAAQQPVVNNYYFGNLEFNDEASVRTLIEFLQSMGDDISLARFQASPLGV